MAPIDEALPMFQASSEAPYNNAIGTPIISPITDE